MAFLPALERQGFHATKDFRWEYRWIGWRESNTSRFTQDFSTAANILGLNVITIKKLLNHRRSKSSDDVTLQYIQVSKKQMRKTMNEIEAFIFNEAGMTQNEVIEKIFKD